ncbi:DUF6160 family protein [Litoribrevibacter euphylliae]
MRILARMAVLPLSIIAINSQALEILSEEELSAMTGQSGVTIDLETRVDIGRVQWDDTTGSYQPVNSQVGGAQPSPSSNTSGVTIELETQVSIGELAWTDTDSGGSLRIGGVQLGGSGLVGGAGGTKLDNLKLTIDSDTYGNLIIGHTALDEAGMLDGSNGIDVGLKVGYIDLSGAAGNTQIISDVNISAMVGPGHTVIFNDGDTGVIQTQGYAEVVDGSAKLDVAGIGIKDLKIYQDSNPFASATYKDEHGNQVSKWSDYTDASQYGVDTDNNGSYETSWADYATDNGNNQWAFSAATIGTKAINGGTDDALWMKVDHSVVDISMTMGIGNGSYDNIGKISIQDLNTTGTQLTIMGH